MDNGELRMENQEGLIAAWLLGCGGFIFPSNSSSLSIIHFQLSIIH
jgi:hypothetical protein